MMMVMMILYLTGINQNHFGIETEFAAQLNEMFRLDIGIGFENGFKDDATGTYRDSDGSDATYSYSLKGLPTGDMPPVFPIFWTYCVTN